MGSYNSKLRANTYLAKDVVEILNLPFGRNTFYKHLTEMGLIDVDHKPTESMQKLGYILYQTPKVWMGGRRIVNTITPFFTDSGIEFIQEKFIENGILKSLED
jgi:hypothetical protein